MHFLGRILSYFVPSRHNAYHPHLLRRRALLVLLAVVLAAEGALVLNMFARESGHSFLAAVIQSEIVSLTNVERAQARVSTLAQNSLLDRSAQAKADDMAARGYFAHQGPDGKAPWAWIEEAGYQYQYAGENLAVRFVDSKDVVVAWMASPTHRANMVKPAYADIGVGIAQGMYQGVPATFVVQHFGTLPAAQRIVQKPPQNAVPVATGRVLAAESGPPAALNDSLARVLGKILSEPRAATMWTLYAVAALLLLALAFAFFHHIQIQSRDMLVPGTVVVGLALALALINSSFLASPVGGGSQAAGVASYASGVLLTQEAFATER